jgi:hypothetical protein
MKEHAIDLLGWLIKEHLNLYITREGGSWKMWDKELQIWQDVKESEIYEIFNNEKEEK